jgi:hypothetical protein
MINSQRFQSRIGIASVTEEYTSQAGQLGMAAGCDLEAGRSFKGLNHDVM